MIASRKPADLPDDGRWNGEVESFLLDHIDAAVIALDLDGKITHWNAHAQALYGWSRDEVLGRDVRTIGLVPSELGALDSMIDRLRAGQGSEGEYELRRKDGTPFLALVKDAPLRARDGRLIGSVGISVDVTERGAIEAALRQRNAELLRAERVAQLVSWEWDLATDVLRFSESAGESPLGLDIPPSRTFKDMLEKRIHPDDRERLRQTATDAIAAGTGFRIDFRGLTPGGRVRHVSCMAEVETDPAGRPIRVWGTSQDVTEQRDAEGALRQSESARRRLLAQLVTAEDDERRRLAADIHDYAVQVLHAAVLRAEALANLLTTREQGEAAGRVEDTLRSAVVNLRNIVAGARLPALDGVEFMPALEAYLDEATADWPVRHRLESRLVREPLPELRAVLFRIVVEAVVNARKHSSASALTVTVENRDDGVSVQVADDGRGFTPDATTLVGAGHYGLASMKERAELAGGWLRVHSKPGAGTRVETWVPHP